MRTEALAQSPTSARMRIKAVNVWVRPAVRLLAAGVLMSVPLSLPVAAAEEAAATQAATQEAATQEGATKEAAATSWETWRAGTSVADNTSLQHGARNFVNFCLGCHSLQFQRWSRIATDLRIPPQVLQNNLLPPGAKPADYIMTAMPAADAETWFGKTPPDLSLMVRARGKDYVYRFLKTFYVDPSRPTGANNLQLPGTAMPAVLSDLEGPKRPVFKNVVKAGGQTEAVFDHFQQLAPGRMTPADYDTFVRDTVNFLDYVSEPAQMQRRAVGIWVVLFLLAFTWIAWLLKKEYWKDVH